MRRRAFLSIIGALAVLSGAATAQFTQQGDKLVGTGAVLGTSGAFQGSSVSLSADGNTAIIGGWVDSSEYGAAWVFVRTNGVWSQQGGKLVGSNAVGNARQGSSVALSADGNTAIVGGVLDNGSTGAAWVFTRTNGVWNQQGDKLVGSDAAGRSEQGVSVSLSADGNTAIVGGCLDDSLTGAAWVFTRAGGAWTPQGGKLVGAGAAGRSVQGRSVSLSADGNTALVGGYADSGDVGAVWVFTRTNGVWSQQGNKLVGTGAAGAARQGYAVSMSADGNTAIVGGYADSNLAGAAWVFVRSSDAWSQEGGKLVGVDAQRGLIGSFQAYSVSLSSDGNTAIVGGYADSNFTGAAWVFTRTGGMWGQFGAKLVGTGANGKAEQGICVCISSDGNTAIVGAFADDNFTGAAWVYQRAVSAVRGPGNKAPRSFGLAQNYPNPFNPTTVISYQLPVAGNVEVSVYDLLGRNVRTLVNEFKLAGTYEVQFDASSLASGVYLCRLTVRSPDVPHLDSAPERDSKSGAAPFVESRKILFLK